MKSLQTNLLTKMRSPFTTVLCILVVLLLIFVFIMLEQLFMHTLSAIDTQSDSLNSVVCSQIRSNLDDMFQIAPDLATIMHSNAQVFQFSNIGKPSSASDHYNLYELLRSISSYRNLLPHDNLVVDFAIYYPAGDVLINMNSYYRTNSYYQCMYSADDVSYDTWLSVISSYVGGQFVSSIENDHYLVYIQSLDNAPTPAANIIVYLNRQAVQKNIAAFEHPSYHICVKMEDEILFSENTSDAFQATMLSYLENPAAYDGDANIVGLASLPLRNTTYYICSSSEGAENMPQSMLRRFYFVAVISAILMVLLLFVMAVLRFLPPILKLYRRIRNEHRTAGSTSMMIPLRQAVEQVLSRNRIGDNMIDQWPVLKNALLERLTYVSDAQDELLNTLSIYNIVFRHPYFAIVIFSFDAAVSSATLNQISSTFGKSEDHDIICVCFPMGIDKLTVLFNFPEKNSHWSDKVSNMRSTLHAQLNMAVLACIGSVQEGTDNIHQSYNDAIGLMEYTIFTGNDAILEFNAYRHSESEYFYPMDVELNLINAVHSGNHQRVLQILKQIHEENFVNRQLRPDVAKVLLHELIGTTSRLIKAPMQNSVGDPISHILSCNTIEEIFFTLQGIYMEICEAAAQHPSEDSERKASFEKYILAHYADPNFSQGNMANDLHMSQNYLSAQFKSLFNVTMVSYVNSIRVKRAAELLLMTDSTVQDIALLCGFSNGDALNRAFKKEYSVTPSNYRSNLKNSGNNANVSASD